MDGDDGGVDCTADTTGNVVVTLRRPELLGLRGVGVVDIIGADYQRRPRDIGTNVSATIIGGRRSGQLTSR